MKELVFRIAVLGLLVKILVVVAPREGAADIVIPMALAVIYILLEIFELLRRGGTKHEH